jgi:4'-phosphopantetheinyl transferase
MCVVNGDTVQVWLVGSDQPDTVVADLTAVLDDEERRRADAMTRAVDRRRYVVAHGATRMIVGRELGAPPEEIRWQRGPQGKPALAGPWTGLEVNLSHSGDLNAVAVTVGRRVGVDVQQVLPALDTATLATRFFPQAEARLVVDATDPDERALRFGRLWSRKEACVKACGGTLTRGLALPVDGPPDLVVPQPVGDLPGPFRVQDVEAPPGFCAAVALEGAQRYRVTCHHWLMPPPAPWGAGPARPSWSG